MSKLYNSETILSVMIGVSLFSIMYIVFSNWQQSQIKQMSYSFQKQQALQIIENQIALRLSGKPCEKSIIKNHLNFEVLKCDAQQIQVKFPAGEITILNQNVAKNVKK